MPPPCGEPQALPWGGWKLHSASQQWLSELSVSSQRTWAKPGNVLVLASAFRGNALWWLPVRECRAGKRTTALSAQRDSNCTPLVCGLTQAPYLLRSHSTIGSRKARMRWPCRNVLILSFLEGCLHPKVRFGKAFCSSEGEGYSYFLWCWGEVKLVNSETDTLALVPDSTVLGLWIKESVCCGGPDSKCLFLAHCGVQQGFLRRMRGHLDNTYSLSTACLLCWDSCELHRTNIWQIITGERNYKLLHALATW